MVVSNECKLSLRMSSQLLVIYSKWHKKTLILVPSSSALHLEVVLSQTILYLSVLLTPFFPPQCEASIFSPLLNANLLHSATFCPYTALPATQYIQFCQECQSNCLDKGVRLAIPGPWAVREGKIIPCQNFFLKNTFNSTQQLIHACYMCIGCACLSLWDYSRAAIHTLI